MPVSHAFSEFPGNPPSLRKRHKMLLFLRRLFPGNDLLKDSFSHPVLGEFGPKDFAYDHQSVQVLSVNKRRAPQNLTTLLTNLTVGG